MPKAKLKSKPLASIQEDDVSFEEALQRAKYPVSSFLWRIKHGAEIKQKIHSKRVAPTHDASIIIKHADKVALPDAQYADEWYFKELLPAVAGRR